MCGSTELTPATTYRNFHGGSDLVFHQRGGPSSLFAPGIREFPVRRARACLACGYLMLGLDPETLAKLRHEASSLEPYT
jgi:hypothetical protein